MIDVLPDLFSLRGVPGHIRSDDGAEFIAEAVQASIAAVGSQTAHSEPGSPWGNGNCESFDAKLRGEVLNGDVFYTFEEASVMIEQGRTHDNSIRPHSSLGHQPPAPEVVIWSAEPRQLSAIRSPHHRHAIDDALTSNPGHRVGTGHIRSTGAAGQD